MSNLREEENYLCSVIKFAQAGFPLGGNGKGAEPNYYIHDAQGNVLAVYSSSMVMYNISLHVTQQYIYGSSRLGAYNRNQQVFPTVLPPFPFTLSNAFTRGQKHYELSNHLGNVNSVISDRKLQTSTDGIYVPDVKSYVDYYPFGFPMEDRSWQQIAYRYGFNGQENDNEIYGVGNFLNFEFRGYDSRLGRWWSVDPLEKKYPWISSYVFCFNDPLKFQDPNGKHGVAVINPEAKTITIKATYFVVTKPIKDRDHYIPTYETAYSINEISDLTKINLTLNKENYQVTEGEYEGYSIKFDLRFIDGGSRESANLSAKRSIIRDGDFVYPIGNTFERANSDIYNNFNNNALGGFVENYKKLVMNSRFDFKRERIHEIFHTFFFDRDNAESGIGNYKPGTDMPNQEDINILINNPLLPKINEEVNQ